ncbi:helix-turn-helix domain-containing protein [Corynebacterium sp. 153RC1]|uniref:sugar-binding transcriptional regulator n=1 Tax=unclassified Corynebacterium TaxID=2624378 RepID=UPI00211CB98C|nr:MULTISPECIES: sugar-binding domain-containing protein [unclassified Corynebacterium]MCQ9370556.1 helix-turn-helix domain-containing protein [Corynebacterium sp. 35RC1]MCQ9352928.1 helix-turn-helix domain-containing protein [Corynebacterium sp. 209RC1]MCQ9353852.1 helix-turn-helix domain-containing protein [Corynebacterium sp. 1222RC1]MCQ9356883.1 helix-turn-helix domain-containing protein [Corynebacterium sp. 122RC1]MCQ9358266.1 helix-turn-helix domain-containing protein [Corynebacterium sp
MNKRKNVVYEAAQLYYGENLTMERVAERLGVSRPTVSRLIAEARQTGVVTIQIHQEMRPQDPLEQLVAEKYHVNAHVVRAPSSYSELRWMRSVASAGAKLVDSLVDSGTTLGVAWGSTVSEVAQYLPRRLLEDVTVVQLNGAGNAWNTGIAYSGSILGQIASAYDAHMVHFPVPAFFDHAETKEAMWRERSIRNVLSVQREAQVAVFGVGAFGGKIPSHVYAGGYFDKVQQAQARVAGVVGDMCTVMLREDGSWEDLAVNKRATGPTPRDLKKIDRRVCVASGAHRAAALRGALRTGAITDLVVSSRLAELIV